MKRHDTAEAMRIYDLLDEKGDLLAFEVSNTFLTRRGLRRILKIIPNTKIIRFTRHDEFCEFEVEGQKFVAWEPWGDNSRYWIGPSSPAACQQLSLVKDIFAKRKFFPFL